MKKLLISVISLCAVTVGMADSKVNPYEARENGYYVGLMESQSGLVATSNRADEIFLIKDGTAKALVCNHWQRCSIRSNRPAYSRK